ncbi:flagellar protein FlaG [Caldicellulosiruptoraceae bacterium PP1]
MGINNIGSVDTISNINPNIVNRNEAVEKTDFKKNDPSFEQEDKNNKLNKKSNIDEDALLEVIQHANKAFEAKYTRLEFSIHKETHEIVVKVFDKETNKLIREIPPEKILDMVAKLWELAGVFVDERR